MIVDIKMANEKHIKKFTASDIEKYHKGLLSPGEMHAMEKASLEDSFLAEAMEGYAVEGVHAETDMQELQERLANRISQNKVLPIGTSTKKFPLLKIAAMLVFILGAGFLVYQMGIFNRQDSIAKTETTKVDDRANENAIAPDSSVQAQPPSTTEEKNENSQQDLTKNNKATTKPPVLTEEKTIPNSPTIVAAKKPDANGADEMAVVSAEPSSVPATMERKEVMNKGKAMQKMPVKKVKAARTRSFNADDKKVLAGKTQNNYIKMLRGRVVDNQLRGVPFANIKNLDNKAVTYSDAKGYFDIPASDSANDLRVRSVGFVENNARLSNSHQASQIILQSTTTLSNRSRDIKRRSVLARSNNAASNINESIPKDGWDNYDNYIVNNIQVPANYDKANDAEVLLSFTVNKYGTPENIIIEKSVSADCDREAVRLVTVGPKWTFINENLRTTISIPF